MKILVILAVVGIAAAQLQITLHDAERRPVQVQTQPIQIPEWLVNQWQQWQNDIHQPQPEPEVEPEWNHQQGHDWNQGPDSRDWRQQPEWRFPHPELQVPQVPQWIQPEVPQWQPETPSWRFPQPDQQPDVPSWRFPQPEPQPEWRPDGRQPRPEFPQPEWRPDGFPHRQPRPEIIQPEQPQWRPDGRQPRPEIIQPEQPQWRPDGRQPRPELPSWNNRLPEQPQFQPEWIQRLPEWNQPIQPIVPIAPVQPEWIQRPNRPVLPPTWQQPQPRNDWREGTFDVRCPAVDDTTGQAVLLPGNTDDTFFICWGRLAYPFDCAEGNLFFDQALSVCSDRANLNTNNWNNNWNNNWQRIRPFNNVEEEKPEPYTA